MAGCVQSQQRIGHFITLSMAAGCVVYHRSGDAAIGLHGNSGLWRPTKCSHRIVLVLYQTDLKVVAAGVQENVPMK